MKRLMSMAMSLSFVAILAFAGLNMNSNSLAAVGSSGATGRYKLSSEAAASKVGGLRCDTIAAGVALVGLVTGNPVLVVGAIVVAANSPSSCWG